MATLKLTSAAAAAAAPAAPAIAAPAWCQPQRLRQWGLRRGWRCQLRPGERWLKRAFDLGLCALVGLPAALLVGLAAVAVRWDSPGPALFAQQRVGGDGRPFRMWKLRTMVVNAQALEAELRPLSELPWPDFKITHDPRITRVGGWLRRTSLDELPQIWNIVRGEMSWVGPRPTSFGLERYQLWHTERLATPPGLTGLWQIVARAGCDFDQRLRLDLAYVRNWRLSLDLAILAATVRAVWQQRGAK
jgi:lipopolysaccharide/colanic/teichoic acid biosynthesis glycosyltransferase